MIPGTYIDSLRSTCMVSPYLSDGGVGSVIDTHGKCLECDSWWSHTGLCLYAAAYFQLFFNCCPVSCWWTWWMCKSCWSRSMVLAFRSDHLSREV